MEKRLRVGLLQEFVLVEPYLKVWHVWLLCVAYLPSGNTNGTPCEHLNQLLAGMNRTTNREEHHVCHKKPLVRLAVACCGALSPCRHASGAPRLPFSLSVSRLSCWLTPASLYRLLLPVTSSSLPPPSPSLTFSRLSFSLPPYSLCRLLLPPSRPHGYHSPCRLATGMPPCDRCSTQHAPLSLLPLLSFSLFLFFSLVFSI